ncbi:MAG: helix-turn-helix transcriptional regulator, partial [Spirochaetota bacterium]|nr:helix-turn-helix transcriptional regulator [Spirochaetota bacterium]
YSKKLYPGETVRFYREMLGLTQKELSLKSGVNKNMISDIENGRKKIGYNTAVKISGVFNRRPERFL